MVVVEWISTPPSVPNGALDCDRSGGVDLEELDISSLRDIETNRTTTREKTDTKDKKR